MEINTALAKSIIPVSKLLFIQSLKHKMVLVVVFDSEISFDYR